MAGMLPHSLLLLRRFPVLNGPIIVSRGHSDWLAMRALKHPRGSRSDYSVFPDTLPPPSVGLLLDRCSLVHFMFSLVGCSCPFEGCLFLFCCWLSNCSPLLPFLFAVLPFLLHAIQ